MVEHLVVAQEAKGSSPFSHPFIKCDWFIGGTFLFLLTTDYHSPHPPKVLLGNRHCPFLLLTSGKVTALYGYFCLCIFRLLSPILFIINLPYWATCAFMLSYQYQPASLTIFVS